jgi:hypothetical protein
MRYCDRYTLLRRVEKLFYHSAHTSAYVEKKMSVSLSITKPIQPRVINTLKASYTSSLRPHSAPRHQHA